VVVDAYVAQHPATPATAATAKSVFVHLVGLCAVLEHGLPDPYVTKLLGEVIRQRYGDFPVLQRTEGPGSLTVLHMIRAHDLADYERRAHEWATAVWGSWSAQHELIRSALHAVVDRVQT